MQISTLTAYYSELTLFSCTLLQLLNPTTEYFISSKQNYIELIIKRKHKSRWKASTFILIILIWTRWLIHIELVLYSSFELLDQLKQRWLSAEAVFGLHRHAMPCHRWRCPFWLSSSESKKPRGTKPETYPLCMGEQGEGRRPCVSAMKGESKLDTDGST